MGFNESTGEYIPDDLPWKYSFNPEGNTEAIFRYKNSAYNSEAGGTNLGKLLHDLIYYIGSDEASIMISMNQTEDYTLAFATSGLNIPFANIAAGIEPVADVHDIVLYDADTAIDNLITPAKSFKKFRLSRLGPNKNFFTDDNKWFWVKVKFIADYVIPDSFNQDLNQESNVEHLSQTVQDLTVENTLSVLGLSTQSRISLTEQLLGNLILTSRPLTTGSYDSSKPDYVKMLPTLVKQFYQGNSALYFGQILSYLSNERVNTEEGIFTTCIHTNVPVGGSSFPDWKLQNDNFVLYHRLLAIEPVDLENRPSYNDFDSGTLNVKSAAALQYNTLYKEWEIGAAPEGLAIENGGDFDDLYHYQEDTPGTVLTKLRYVFPFVVRSHKIKADLTEGAIPFFAVKDIINPLMESTPFEAYYKGRLDSQSFFKVRKDTNDYTFVTVPIEIRSQYSSNADSRTKLTESFLELNQDVDSHLNAVDPYILVRKQGASSQGGGSVVQAFLLKQLIDTFQLVVFDEKTTSAVPGTPTAFSTGSDSYYNLFNMSFAKNSNTKTLTIGNFLANPLTFTLNLYGETINLGVSSENDSSINVYGTTFFNKRISLYAAYTYPVQWTERIDLQTANPPYGSGSNQETGRYSIDTTGKINSPSIASIWKYLAEVVGGDIDTYTSVLLDKIPAETAQTDWLVPALTFTPAADVHASVQSWINAVMDNATAYQSFVPVTSGSEWAFATNPRSLRKLEAMIIKERYNYFTLFNFLSNQTVNRGNTADTDVASPNTAGFGTLYQLQKDEAPYVTGAIKHEGTNDAIPRSQIILAADGDWHNVNEVIRLPIR
jgi:hypothetical protein